MNISKDQIIPTVQKLIELTDIDHMDIAIDHPTTAVLNGDAEHCPFIGLRVHYNAFFQIKNAFDPILIGGEREYYCVKNFHGDSGKNLMMMIGKFKIIGCHHLAMLHPTLRADGLQVINRLTRNYKVEV